MRGGESSWGLQQVIDCRIAWERDGVAGPKNPRVIKLPSHYTARQEIASVTCVLLLLVA